MKNAQVKKLDLHKRRIALLQSAEMIQLNGGGPTTIPMTFLCPSRIYAGEDNCITRQQA